MADKSQLSAEAIASELENLRQQKRSFALQRAEGLIDSELQRDLVENLDKRIAELENMKNGAGEPKEVAPAEPDPVETPAVGDSGTVSDESEPEKAEAQAVEAEVVESEENLEPSEQSPVTESSEEPEEAETQASEEDVVATEPAAPSEEQKNGEAQILNNVVETQAVRSVQTEDNDGLPESSEEESEDTEADKVDEPADDEAPTQAKDDELVVEEEQHPMHHDDDKSSGLGPFASDVVVSSALVKEPDYLNEIHEPNIVDIRDITKVYKMGEFELEVLKGITLQVHKGEFISIMGPSGSGKSTLMNILGALDQPTSGDYFLDSVDVSKMNEKQLAEIRNSKIGFVFQSFNLLKRTSALRQVELPLIYGSHKDRTRLAREALEAVGLGQRLHHTPAELSGGQQQRVAIARALVTEPSLILADEPTGNLDSRSGNEVMQIFQKMNRENNITTIFVTHDPWIARHTDRVIMLRDGKIIADQRVKSPLVAGESDRRSETQELQAIFNETYYGGDEEEYT